jgi:hypothetical protein
MPIKQLPGFTIIHCKYVAGIHCMVSVTISQLISLLPSNMTACLFGMLQVLLFCKYAIKTKVAISIFAFSNNAFPFVRAEA